MKIQNQSAVIRAGSMNRDSSGSLLKWAFVLSFRLGLGDTASANGEIYLFIDEFSPLPAGRSPLSRSK